MRVKQMRGFTLVELVVVIVLLGIVGTFTFSFIGFGARIYHDTTEREQLVSQSRYVVNRLSSELRNALPRSMRVLEGDSQRCIEFVPIITSSNYLQLPKLNNPSDDFIGVLPIRSSDLQGSYLYVYATNAGYIYADSDRRKEINSVSADSPEQGWITIDYAGDPFTTDSPARRFYITSGPVSWCYNDSARQIVRFTDYGLQPQQPSYDNLVASGEAREVMATGLVNDLTDTQYPFKVYEATLQRSNLIQIDWRFQRSESGERLQILHEVHVPNVP